MSWTDERIEELRRMWGEGLSASQIAGALGGVSRNAVIGKIHRLGLSGRVKAPQRNAQKRQNGNGAPNAGPARPRAAPASPRVMAVGSTVVKVVGEEAYEPSPAPLSEAEVVPLHGGVSLLDLGTHRCRWPLGDPAHDGFAFCGAHTWGGDVYCRAHAEVAFPSRRKGTR